MPCYGGVCDESCVMFKKHHGLVVICEQCGSSLLKKQLAGCNCSKCGAILLVDEQGQKSQSDEVSANATEKEFL